MWLKRLCSWRLFGVVKRGSFGWLLMWLKKVTFVCLLGLLKRGSFASY